MNKSPEDFVVDMEAIWLSFYSHEDVRKRLDEYIAKHGIPDSLEGYLDEEVCRMEREIKKLKSALAIKRALRTVVKKSKCPQ